VKRFTDYQDFFRQNIPKIRHIILSFVLKLYIYRPIIIKCAFLKGKKEYKLEDKMVLFYRFSRVITEANGVDLFGRIRQIIICKVLNIRLYASFVIIGAE